MKTVRIFAAQDVNSDYRPLRPTTIIIEEPIPNIKDDRRYLPSAEFWQESHARFQDQAEQLFSALANSLPGGTLDRLLGLMLEAKASHFVVPSWQEKEE